MGINRQELTGCTPGRTRRAPEGAPGTRLFACLMLALPLTLTWPLAGCGSAGGAGASAAQDSDGSGSDSPGDASANSGDQPADPDAGMVAAVNPSGSGAGNPPISVKFRLEARPMVGTPVKIMVAVLASADAQIDHLHGSFLPGEGLTLQSDRTFDAQGIRSGTPLYHELTVVPMQTGVLSLSATILVDMPKNSESRTYSIPLIATDSST